jgi:MFS family permease
MNMTIDDPINIEQLARSLEEPLLPQQPLVQEGDPGVAAVPENDGTNTARAAITITAGDSRDGRSANDRELPVLHDGMTLKDSLLVKSLYFLDALGSSAWGRFSAIYYNNHGLNTQQIGVIEGLRTFTPTISSVFWGYISDRYRCRKSVWVWTKSGGTTILLLLALPCVTKSFSRILSVSVGAQLFVSNGAILDAFTLELLGTKNKLLYGRYRLYASISWGLGSIIMGWVTDNYGFDWNFIMFGGLSILMIVLVSYYIPNTINTDNQQRPNTSTRNRNRNSEETDTEDESDSEVANANDNAVQTGDISDLLKLVMKPRVLFFFVEVVVMGAAMATVERLLFLYLVNDLYASTLLCGLSVGVNVLFELPIFWYASSILNYLGSDGMFLLSMTCFVVRVFGYTLLTPSTKYWILVLESMHGVTFATFWIVTTDMSKVLIDESKGGFWSTTIPSMLQMLYSAVGATIGSVLGGFAMHRYGSRQMYRFTAASVFCMLLVHLFGIILIRIYCRRVGGSVLPECSHQVENGNNEENADEPEDDEIEDAPQ